MSLTVFWFRRDLRIKDNHALYQALKQQIDNVQPIFIFDSNILTQFQDPNDFRVPFIHQTVSQLKAELQSLGSDLWVYDGKPQEVFKGLTEKHQIKALYFNHDYEPKSIRRDQEIAKLCQKKGIEVYSFKDHVIFEKSEILTTQNKPYTVFTPYKRKWLKSLSPSSLQNYSSEKETLSLYKAKIKTKMPSLESMGYKNPGPQFVYPKLEISKNLLKRYQDERDYPALGSTSRLGIHLRFGTLSIREAARAGKQWSETWLSELIWRDFFIQVLYHFPEVEKFSFRPEYENIEWRKSKSDFQKWSEGRTGFPLVDAGMRELNQTGYMHNRVRMVTASFLTKHLLQHWSRGEKYFASKLLDYELAVNNGNWQWASGSGCDAAPYFRIFNPETQLEKFDPDHEYVRKWIPELGTKAYPKPMIDHNEARERALRAYYRGLKGKFK